MRWLLLLAALPAFSQTASQIIYADLSGDWRMRAGEHTSFAAPDADDRGWGTVRLPFRSFPPAGYSWLRRTVELPAGADLSSLAIALGNLPGSYEVYVNAVKVGSQPRAHHQIYIPPRTFSIPSHALSNSHRIVIAIRVFYDPSLLGNLYGVADEGPYLLAGEEAARSAAAESLERWRRKATPDALFGFATAFWAICLFAAWRSAREWPIFFWFALSMAEISFLYFSSYFGYTRPAGPFLFMAFHWEMILAAYRRPPLGWRYVFWPPALAMCVVNLFDLPASVPVQGLVWLVLALGSFVLAIAGLRGRRVVDRMLVIPLAVFSAFYVNASWVVRIVPVATDSGLWRWDNYTAIFTFWSMVMFAILLRRITTDIRDKQRMAAELEAARVVQNLLIARKPEQSPGYEVEAVYRPAFEVGGDFYQCFSIEDGSLLVLVGDVSGNGLKAAMTVSMIVGVLQSRRSNNPPDVLKDLNRAVLGRLDGGFITCCCGNFASTGAVRLANAGHLAPYWNGREITMAGGLPLGLVSDADYEEASANMAPGDMLTFLSDGVIEAADANAELFGFERTCEISVKPAAEIASAAQAFGQTDDITVVTVRSTLMDRIVGVHPE